MKKIFLIKWILFSAITFAQPPTRFYSKFGGSGVDIGNSVKEIYQKQYIVIGSTTSYGAGNADAYLSLLDSMGILKWQKTFGGALADVGKNVIMNPIDSGFVFAGFTASFGNGGYDVYVVRTDKNGNLIWQESFGGTDWDFANDLTFALDGHLIICGNTYSMGYGASDGYILKIDINTGLLIWQKVYGGTQDDEFKTIKLTSDGKYTLGGNTKSFGDLNNDFWMFKSGILGDSILSKRISISNNKEYCYDFIEDNTNSLVFCGSIDTSYNNVGKNVAYLIKTDLNGSFVSEFKNPGAYLDDDKFSSITNSKNGIFYCMARKVNNGFYSVDIQPLLVNHNYAYFAAATYAGNLDEEANKIIFTSDGGYAMIGFTYSFGAIGEDVFFLKLDSSILNSTSIVGIKEKIQNSALRRVFYFENVIRFDNDAEEILSCKLYNSEGNLIESKITKENSYSITDNLMSGLYIFRIESNTGNQSLKFIKH